MTWSCFLTASMPFAPLLCSFYTLCLLVVAVACLTQIQQFNTQYAEKMVCFSESRGLLCQRIFVVGLIRWVFADETWRSGKNCRRCAFRENYRSANRNWRWERIQFMQTEQICRIVMREDGTFLCVSAIIYFDKTDVFSYKNLIYCSLKAARVKELFPLCGSLALNGFYTVKVKGFIPIGAVIAHNICTHISHWKVLDEVSIVCILSLDFSVSVDFSHLNRSVIM